MYYVLRDQAANLTTLESEWSGTMENEKNEQNRLMLTSIPFQHIDSHVQLHFSST
jgi:hypothetical protein